ncbi:MAG: MEDS domain-containing protein [Betaproteobacteria bacterium]
MNSWQSLLERPEDGNHIAQLYQDEESLIETLSHFVGAGLMNGEAVVVFVTPRHWEACLKQLGAHRVAPQDAELRGQVVVVDARSALSRFMVNGTPDWKKFQDLVGTVLNLTRRRYPRIRAFGEMVDLLWQRGERAAALRLEELWNHLIKVQNLTLCCAYHIDPLNEDADHDSVQSICALHSHMLPVRDHEALEQRVGCASESLLGSRGARLLRELAAVHRPSTQMPDVQSTMLWMKEHMPITAAKILSRLRAKRRRKPAPALAEA